MYDDRAFAILGLEPTMDGRAVRRAYVRLARIYHPDRFSGQPDDVREEADRRMRQVTGAYEYVRARHRQLRSTGTIPRVRSEAWDDAERFRREVTRRHQQVLARELRHERWEQLERDARARAERDAELAGTFSTATAGAAPPSDRASAAGRRRRSQLEIRLEDARSEGSLAIRDQ